MLWGRLTSNSLWGQQWQLSERVALVQAVEQPDEIAVPADDLCCASRAGDFVVAVLEHEDTLFLREGRDGDDLVVSRCTGQSPNRRAHFRGGIGATAGSTCWSAEAPFS